MGPINKDLRDLIMLKSFKQFNEEKIKEGVITFGRFNPPTIGHLKLIERVAKEAAGNNYFIFVSHSVDPKKNPLDYKTKLNILRKMFPKYARNIIDSDVNNVFQAASYVYERGYNRLKLVVGSDRVKEFTSILKKYEGVKGKHGFYSFPEGIEIVSAGDRDPDADDVSGMSSSKMRKAVQDGDFQSFLKGLPKGYTDGNNLFNVLRSAMGLEKMKDFREHVQLEPISDKREKYILGEIFNIGDIAIYEGKEVIIIHRKPNYIINESNNKIWLKDLTETTKKSRYKEIYDAIPDKIVDKYGDRAEEVRIEISKKLAHKKFDGMTIPEMMKKITGATLKSKGNNES